MALVLAVVVAAGCGGQARQPEPRLAQADANELVSIAQQVARDAPTDGCAATREIEALSAKANELVDAGRVPVRLRAPLLAGVAAVAADAPVCTPAPAPAPAAPVEKHDNGKHKGKDNGKGKDKGHGHGDEG